MQEIGVRQRALNCLTTNNTATSPILPNSSQTHLLIHASIPCASSCFYFVSGGQCRFRRAVTHLDFGEHQPSTARLRGEGQQVAAREEAQGHSADQHTGFELTLRAVMAERRRRSVAPTVSCCSEVALTPLRVVHLERSRGGAAAAAAKD